MNVQDFCRKIGLMPEAARLLDQLQLTDSDYEKGKSLFYGDREGFYQWVLGQEQYRLKFLYFFCRMGCETLGIYRDRKIPEQIYWDTFRDITYWCLNCYREYGEYGIDEYLWFTRHYDLTIFRLGRLQFEYMNSVWDLEGSEGKISKGDPIISVHIPQGEPLKLAEAISSCKMAFDFCGTERPYLCHSWLLYPGLKQILPPDSNILQFSELFELLRVDYEDREAEWRVFSRVERNLTRYPEHTSLQRALKQYLLEGNAAGSGMGLLRMKQLQ